MVDKIKGFVRSNADEIILQVIALIATLVVFAALVEIVSCSTHHVYY